jgi:hypothetical protein
MASPAFYIVNGNGLPDAAVCPESSAAFSYTLPVIEGISNGILKLYLYI